MHKFLILLMILTSSAMATDFHFEWGGGCSGQAGYSYYDTLYVTDWFEAATDTIFGPIYDTTTAVCTTLSISGEGWHVITVVYKPSGYEWYTEQTYYVNHLSGLETGDGLYPCSLWAIDTANDSAVSAVTIDINTAAGADWLSPKTGTSGYVVVMLDAGTYKISGASIRYQWSIDRTLTVAAGGRDSVMGYQTFEAYVIAAPADSNLCQLYGYLYDNQQQPVKYAQVTIKAPQVNRNTCSDTYVQMPRTISTTTNKDGYWTIDVLKCSCMPDTTLEYKIMFQAGATRVGDLSINIPADSGTYRVIGQF